MRWLARLGDDIIYSLLTIIFFAPVITAGAAAAASYEIFRNIANEEVTGIPEWFRLFKTHFKRMTLLELMLLLPLCLVIFLLWPQSAPAVSSRVILFAVLLFALFSLVLTMVFAVPIAVNYPELRVIKVLKNAFRYSVGYLPRSIVILAAASVPFAVYAVSYEWFYYIGFIWAFFWPGECFRLAVKLVENLL